MPAHFIRMPIAALVSEHKKLIPILSRGSLRERKAEAADQRMELKKYIRLMKK
jgi:hypothetical protein